MTSAILLQGRFIQLRCMLILWDKTVCSITVTTKHSGLLCTWCFMDAKKRRRDGEGELHRQLSLPCWFILDWQYSSLGTLWSLTKQIQITQVLWVGWVSATWAQKWVQSSSEGSLHAGPELQESAHPRRLLPGWVPSHVCGPDQLCVFLCRKLQSRGGV